LTPLALWTAGYAAARHSLEVLLVSLTNRHPNSLSLIDLLAAGDPAAPGENLEDLMPQLHDPVAVDQALEVEASLVIEPWLGEPLDRRADRSRRSYRRTSSNGSRPTTLRWSC
jgi:hypothetical protein